MLLFLVLPLVWSAQFSPCSKMLSLHLSEEFNKCQQMGESCTSVRLDFEQNSKDCVMNSGLFATSQSLSDFVTGFYNGIQKDASEPSECIKSYPYIKSSIENFIYGIKQIGFSPLIQTVFNLNEFINRIATTYALCNFSTLYNILHPGSIWNQFSFIFSHWLMAKDQVRETWGKLFQALDSNNFISAGIFTGKLITLLTSYSL